jgi:electron transfer flavoprotein beta subunit
VISLGPVRAVEAIRTALAMGCDKAIHIDDENSNPDAYVISKALAKVIRDQGFEIVFAGKQAIDLDNGQVTQQVAEFLGWPQVMILEKIDIAGGKATATRRISGAKEVYEVPLPAIFGCEKGLNTPRYASLPGIMKAKTKPVETLKLSAVKGDAQAKLAYSNYRLPAEKPPGKMLQGDAATQVKELVRLLREEAKVI